MSRALRYSPPVVGHGLITRPRLLAHLQRRFDRPLTAVVAPAGFGKTTLLAQALRENELAPLGEDHWLTCQRDDTTMSFLAGGIFSAVGVSAEMPDDPGAAALAVAEAIWSAAPRQIALVLDDAHLVGADSPGARFLSALLDELPGNGHLVLAARPPLPVRVSRMLANGRAVVLDEAQMQFHEDELAAFARARDVEPALLDDVGGWPALAELTATVGEHAVTGYVWEELVSALDPARRRALGVLVAVGGADPELARALLGADVDLDAMLDGLPLVVRAADGWRSLHALWASAVQPDLTAGEIADARRTAGLLLARRRQYHDAMDLLIDAEAWPDVRSVVVDVCEVCTPLVPSDPMAAWQRRLPEDVRSTPEGVLLAAMVAEPDRPDLATRLLEQAVADAADDIDVQYACINALVQLAFWRSDRRGMKELLEQLRALAARGQTKAPGWIALLTGLLARSPDDVRRALAAPGLADGEPLSPVQDWLHAHVVLLKLGDAEAGERLARRALAHNAATMTAVSRAAVLESLRMRGRLGEVESGLPALLADLNPAKVQTSPELVTCAVATLDVLGRVDEAGALLSGFTAAMAASPVAWAPVAGALARAFHHVSTGDEAAALAAVAPLRGHPLLRTQAVAQVSPTAMTLLYVLLPEARAAWDDEAPPGFFADLHAHARALVALREDASLDAVRAMPRSAHRNLRAALPPPWSTELAVASVAVGHDDGRELLEELGRPARAILRDRISRTPTPIAATARTLLRQLPAVPAYRLRLTTLGPLELTRDGVPSAAPELRRERVRQLLAYLVTQRRVTRAAITADLWPDLAENPAGRNLRVTLAYLQNVFEPDRSELDAPYFIRSSGGSLQLVLDEALEIDAHDFERLLDDAARLEQQGALSSALEVYARAVGLWHGDYFVGLPAADWLQWERDRLRGRFVTAAVRAGNLELARGGGTAAGSLAEQALAADEWSEPAYQLLVAHLLGAGDLVGARRALQRCRAMLHELGVSAQQRTVALARQIDASG